MLLFGALANNTVSPTATSLSEASERITKNDTSLKEIFLASTKLSDQNLSELCQLLQARPHIRLNMLDLSYNPALTDSCTAALSQIQMKKINMSGTRIQNTGVHQLLQNNTLQHVILQLNQIENLDPIYFQKNTRLLSIDLTSNALNANDVLAVLHCKSLRSVTLDNNPSSLTPTVLEHLAQSEVTHLSLAFNQLGDTHISILQQSRQRILNLSNNQLSLTGAELFFNHPRVTKLVLRPGNSALISADAERIANSCDKVFSKHCNWKFPAITTISTRNNGYQKINTL